jgi:toxin ParE1/3/4
MFRFILNENAEEDLIRIHDYGTGQFGIIQADKYYDEFFNYFEKIASNPLMFPISRQNPSYRSCVCGVDTIYFRINNDLVEIMAIIGRQDY